MTTPISSPAPTTPTLHDASSGSDSKTTVLGVVSFLNAKPLYRTLRDVDDIGIRPDVPAKLAEALLARRCDLALLPVVDYWRYRDRLERVSDGCIASDGETMTVRVYSKIPPDRVTTLQGDSHSHTSIILAHVIWRELYGRDLALTQPDADAEKADRASPGSNAQVSPEAVLRIGDKVVRTPPRGFGFEVDLGAAWKHLTGLPFVFAAWFGLKSRNRSANATLAAQLEAARDAGVSAAEQIAREDAEEHGWPEPTAIRYLRDVMLYKLTDDMHRGMDRFFDLATRSGFLP